MSQDFHKLKVSLITSETDQAKSIYFDIPASLSDAYKYAPGQYLTLKFNIKGDDVRRAYSICTSPIEDKVGVNVKRVTRGLVSNYINDQIKVGDEIDVMMPEGKFGIELDEAYKRDFYFFASGSGITPVISIMKTILEHESMSRCYLLYGNRNEDSIIFKEELGRLAKKYTGQFGLTHTLSKPNREKTGGLKGMFSKGKITWPGWQGRINGDRINKFLEENPKQGKETHYFVCGPGAMIDTVTDHLEKRGVGSDRLHSERFATASGPSIPVSGGVESKVKIHLAGKTYDVIVPPSKTILDVLIEEKIDAPYSCTSGACSTCVGKVVKGEVSMDMCYALDDAEVKDGFVLVCQGRANSEEVEITFEA